MSDPIAIRDQAVGPARRLDNVAVAVRDLAAAHRFFEGVVGMDVPQLDANADTFVARLGEVSLFVFRTPTRDRQKRSVQGFRENPPGYDHLVFAVDDISAAELHLSVNGVLIEASGKVPLPDGGEGLFLRFRDPEGNLVGFMQRMPAQNAGAMS